MCNFVYIKCACVRMYLSRVFIHYHYKIKTSTYMIYTNFTFPFFLTSVELDREGIAM